jgi:hypothetical protein
MTRRKSKPSRRIHLCLCCSHIIEVVSSQKPKLIFIDFACEALKKARKCSWKDFRSLLDEGRGYAGERVQSEETHASWFRVPP